MTYMYDNNLWGRHARASNIEAVFLTDVCREYQVCEETAKQVNEENKLSTAAIVSLDYEISAPHIIRHSRVLI